MKKLLAIIILIVFLTPALSFASDLQDSVINELKRFYQSEQGNRVTQYNMEALIGRIGAIFIKVENKPEKKDGLSTRPDISKSRSKAPEHPE